MAFKKVTINNTTIESPEALFGDLRNRKVEGLLSQQADMLREYLSRKDSSDLALELPTGSGKTLVGLLIAEWRRRKYKEKCVFLCPTNQLVYQVAEQAQENYGIKPVVLTGSRSDYSTIDTSKYESCENIAITTYSSLFNSNPYFNDADVFIFDDAHSAENYVSSCWSLEINNYDPLTVDLFEKIKNIIFPLIEENDKLRFLNQQDENIDFQHVSKLPTPYFLKVSEKLYSEIDSLTINTKLQYKWQMLKNNFHACNLFFTNNKFLIRPFIPPTESFSPFIGAKQRIYMSATLGEGGDLERIFGRKKIERIAAPKNYEKQGVGRKFFIFPLRMWDKDEAIHKTIDLIRKVPRALILCPKEKDVKEIKTYIKSNAMLDSYKIYGAKDIEISKKEFVSSDNAIAILANRYDGIDLSEDECRYLIINQLPEATNLQEKFIISKLNSPILYRERIKTRVIQAVGRCTRKANDWAMVCILGEKLNQYFLSPQKTSTLPVELQAEIRFGIEQSIPENNFEENLNENIDAFLQQNEDWDAANDTIIDIRTQMIKESLENVNILEEIVSKEIDYMNCLWNSDFNKALSIAIDIYSKLNKQPLRGYKGLWLYMAANAALLAENRDKAKELYNKAGEVIISLGWLKSLSRCLTDDKLSDDDIHICNMLDNIETFFQKTGFIEKHKFNKITSKIKADINSNEAKHFEKGQVRIAEILGLNAFNSEESGATDPCWILTNKDGLVFEDYTNTGETTSQLSKRKVLQSGGHLNTLRSKHPELKFIKFVTVICSNVVKLHPTAIPQADELYFVSLDDFRTFGNDVISFVEILWENYTTGSPNWREFAFNKFKEMKLTPKDIYAFFTKTKLKELATE